MQFRSGGKLQRVGVNNYYPKHLAQINFDYYRQVCRGKWGIHLISHTWVISVVNIDFGLHLNTYALPARA